MIAASEFELVPSVVLLRAFGAGAQESPKTYQPALTTPCPSLTRVTGTYLARSKRLSPWVSRIETELKSDRPFHLDHLA